MTGISLHGHGKRWLSVPFVPPDGSQPIHARWTRYSFDGHTITGDGPVGRKISVRVEDICEIGVETNDAGVAHHILQRIRYLNS